MGNFISDLFVAPDTMGSDDFYGFVQVLFHGMVYAYILFHSSNMISEGSELLLLTPFKGIVGSIVLPILGAVPDGAIILFSGSDQLSVGVGALAGSTIMLLTVPWCLAMLAGRVDMAVPKVKGPGAAAAIATATADYPIPKYSGKPTERLTEGVPLTSQLTKTGVSVDGSIRRAGIFMVVTSLSYILVQFPGFGFHCQFTDCDCDKGEHLDNGTILDATPAGVESCLEDKHNNEKPYIIASLALSVLLFVWYIYDQYVQSSKDDGGKMDRKIEEIGKNALKRGLPLDFCVFLNAGHRENQWGCCGGGDDLELHNLTDGNAKLNFDRAIVKLFNKYNTSKSDGEGPEIIDSMEVGKLLTDLHMTGTSLWLRLKDAAEKSALTLPRFSKICWDYVLESGDHNNAGSVRVDEHPNLQASHRAQDDADDEEYDEDEELEVPEGMEGKDLSQPAQQREIWKRALTQMLMGTAIVMFFSDPMCDILSDLGRRTGINAFYVSFVLAPLASNASELIAAYNYALKKTVKTMTISVSTLLGAACMNNTFCLAIFLLKIVQDDKQVWQFSAETISILFVEYFMFFFALKEHHPMYYALIVASIFPLSIVMVAGLEAAGLD
eukprot:TRINITY_DN504_c0_g2_i1.p1 TRINITY_DN504_c0_g2~~TRINITY_DN504_c0_g2_i1.p1  ORF type:complete len:625 (+),score=229.71 TRINITY_DN504_c0_g2_i1:48-1877(+)